jgi:hypothetical protein
MISEEFIARADAGPRERLLDDIEYTIMSAISHFAKNIAASLDVASVKDLIMRHAIQSCNYTALGWLQDTLKLDLYKNSWRWQQGPVASDCVSMPKAERCFEMGPVDSSWRPRLHSLDCAG